MDSFAQDLRYAVRTLRKTPGFTLVAVLTLGLGIGANASLFSLLNAALFRSVTAAEPGRLVWVAGTAGENHRYRSLSYPEYRAYRDSANVFAGLMAYQDVALALGSGGVSLLLAVVAALASYVPVRRATLVDPMAALRVE